MSWNSSMLFVGGVERPDFGRLIAELELLADPVAEGEIDFQAALDLNEMTSVAVGHVGSWTLIAGLPVMLADDDVVAAHSAGRSIVSLILGGASSTYGFTLFRDGVLVRQVVDQEGEMIADSGDPLPEERDLDDYPYAEARILEIVSRLTVPLDTFDSVAFEIQSGTPALS
jgi:hypothetical protein